MEQVSIKKEIFEEINKFLCFKNPNNFDEYIVRVFPKSSKSFLKSFRYK